MRLGSMSNGRLVECEIPIVRMKKQGASVDGKGVVSLLGSVSWPEPGERTTILRAPGTRSRGMWVTETIPELPAEGTNCTSSLRCCESYTEHRVKSGPGEKACDSALSPSPTDVIAQHNPQGFPCAAIRRTSRTPSASDLWRSRGGTRRRQGVGAF